MMDYSQTLVVPEPTSICLIVLVGLVALRRLRALGSVRVLSLSDVSILRRAAHRERPGLFLMLEGRTCRVPHPFRVGH